MIDSIHRYFPLDINPVNFPLPAGTYSVPINRWKLLLLFIMSIVITAFYMVVITVVISFFVTFTLLRGESVNIVIIFLALIISLPLAVKYVQKIDTDHIYLRAAWVTGRIKVESGTGNTPGMLILKPHWLAQTQQIPIPELGSLFAGYWSNNRWQYFLHDLYMLEMARLHPEEYFVLWRPNYNVFLVQNPEGFNGLPFGERIQLKGTRNSQDIAKLTYVGPDTTNRDYLVTYHPSCVSATPELEGLMFRYPLFLRELLSAEARKRDV